MSYYSGDFYQGDPGFLSFLGKIGKAAVGFIPGVGPVAKAGVDVVSSALSKSRVGRAVLKHPTLSAAGAAGGVGAGMGFVAPHRGGMKPPTGPPMGTNGRGRGPSPFGRRRRRMRVTNMRALRRAIRRAKGFERLARKVVSFTSPRKAKGHAHFRVRRKK